MKTSTRCAMWRRSCGRDGGVDGELGRPGERVSARRGARWRRRACAVAIATAERAREKMRWRRGGRRCSADVGARVEGEAGRLRCAASFVGTWRPRGVRALTLQSGVAHGSRGTARSRPGRLAQLGQRRGATRASQRVSERASTEAGQAGVANWAESEAAAHKVKM